MKATVLLIALLSAAASASATDVGQHPAVFSPRTLPGIDASTFIVGHPAGGAPGQAEQPRAPKTETSAAVKAGKRVTAAL